MINTIAFLIEHQQVFVLFIIFILLFLSCFIASSPYTLSCNSVEFSLNQTRSMNFKRFCLFNYFAVGMLFANLTLNIWPYLHSKKMVLSNYIWDNHTCENSTIKSYFPNGISYIELSICIVFFTVYFFDELLQATVRFNWYSSENQFNNFLRINRIKNSLNIESILKNYNNKIGKLKQLNKRNSLTFILSFSFLLIMEGFAIGTLHKSPKMWTSAITITFNRMIFMFETAEKIFCNEYKNYQPFLIYILIISSILPIGIIIVILTNFIVENDVIKYNANLLFGTLAAGILLYDIVNGLRKQDSINIRLNGLFQFLAMYAGFNVILCTTFLIHNKF